MPGHGERFIETYEDWFVRINKRVQRLERRLAHVATVDTTAATGPAVSGVVPGVVVLWGGPTPPDGWLVCDGGTYPAIDYPRLADALGSSTGTVFVPDVVAPDGLVYIIKI